MNLASFLALAAVTTNPRIFVKASRACLRHHALAQPFFAQACPAFFGPEDIRAHLAQPEFPVGQILGLAITFHDYLRVLSFVVIVRNYLGKATRGLYEVRVDVPLEESKGTGALAAI